MPSTSAQPADETPGGARADVHPDPLAPLLAGGRTVVIDGGLATELEASGHVIADRLWSARLLADEPGAIVDTHLAYYRAGAQLAITASYQATFQGFASRGFDRVAAAELFRRSVELAAEARERHLSDAGSADSRLLLVAASVGPYGAVLADGSEYRGQCGLDRAALRDFHRERLQVLWDAGPDLLACETIPDLAEVVALADLLDETDAIAWLSLSCRDGRRLRDGTPVEEAAAIADETPGFVATGVNCVAPEHVAELVARIRATTAKPIVVYPNSGEGWDPAARRWLPAAGATVDVATARTWVAAGANLVGGCCRVGPAVIAELAREFAAPSPA